MAAKTWNVIDSSFGSQPVPPNTKLSAPGASGLAVNYEVARGGLSDGVEMLTVENGDLKIRIVPTRGMSIWDMTYGEQRLGWKSPVRGPVHPAFVDVGEPSGLGWLDGFDELLVRCGLESNGAPEFKEDGTLLYPLHGRIGNKPARRVDVTIDPDSSEITVVGVVEEVRFHFLKLRLTTTIRTRVGEKGFRIQDRVTNLSQSPAEIQMLYHVNFGDPLLDAGSKVIAPIKTIVPRNAHAAEGIGNWSSYEAPQPGFEEQVYFFELLGNDEGETQAILKNAHGTEGALLKFNKKQLPCFTVWKNTTSLADGYVTGIEPGTNFPNPRSYEGEQGRVVKIGPSGSFDFDFELAYLSHASEVEAAESAIAKLQAGVEPQVYAEPQEGWCAP
ncbi:MAG: aldose 1-epimerase family protein [Planctomycetaceae bacterium]|nr:aldose 1-epimerase family protein [Planctomycetales bacterium]MCB9873826.1 aldose 1-epimerase family protein [Planctomycetaceae bacterium]MCB9941434.1 aldose 1-epimerase family protein [Planctomycetaceae bacterium]